MRGKWEHNCGNCVFLGTTRQAFTADVPYATAVALAGGEAGLSRNAAGELLGESVAIRDLYFCRHHVGLGKIDLLIVRHGDWEDDYISGVPSRHTLSKEMDAAFKIAKALNLLDKKWLKR